MSLGFLWPDVLNADLKKLSDYKLKKKIAL